MMKQRFGKQNNTFRIALMSVLLAGACILTYYFHSILKTGTVFTHLFYFPIILASLWWKRKGLFVALFLGIIFLSGNLIFTSDSLGADDYFRSLIFISISLLVSGLSEQIEKSEKILQEQANALTVRVKALDCLYGISKLWENPDISFEVFLQKAVSLIPLAWQYPRISCARISVSTHEYKTENFQETPWKKTTDIMASGSRIGILEVFYPESAPEEEEGIFLNEERRLLNAIARRLGRAIEHEQAKALLKQERDAFSSVLEESPYGIVLIDETDQYLYINPEFNKITGYTLEDIPSRKQWFEKAYPNPDVRAEITELWKKDRNRKRGEHEFSIVCKDGVIKDIYMRAIWLDNGRVFITLQDITYQKQSQAKIEHLVAVLDAIRNVNQLITREKNSEKLLNGACNNLTKNRGYRNAWIALSDNAGGFPTFAEDGLGDDFLLMKERLTHGNPPRCAQLSLNQSDIVITENPSACPDCPLSNISPEAMGTMTIRLAFQKKVYGFLVVSTPRELLTDDEEKFLFRELAEDIAYALNSIDQEAERKHMERILMESDRRWRLLFNSANDALIVHRLTENGALKNFMEANDRAYEMFGYTREEFLSLSHNDITASECMEKLPVLIKDLFTYGHILFEIVLRTKYNKKIQAEVNATLFDFRGQTSALSVVRDISERKKHEAELKRYQNQLEKKVKKRTSELTQAIDQLQKEIAERRDMEKALKASEKKYSMLVKNSPDIIYLLDAEGNFVFVGGAAESLLEFTSDQLIGKHFSFIIWPEDLEKSRWYVNERRTGERASKRAEVRFITKTGYIIAELNAVGIYDKAVSEKNKTFMGTYGVARDVTLRKKAEEALRESEERFRTLVENAPIGLCISSSGGIVEYYNPKFVEIFGYTTEDTPDFRSWLQKAYPDKKYRKKVISAWKKNLKIKHHVQAVVFKVVCQDGQNKTISFNSVNLKNGKYVITFEDITTQAKARQRIQKGRAIFQAALDAISDPLMMLDQDMSVQMLNHAAIKYYQISELNKIIKQPCFKSLRRETNLCRGCKIALVVQKGEHKSFEQKSLIYPDNYEQITIYPLQKAEAHGMTGAMVRISDITEKRKTQEQLIRADRLSSLGQLSGGIAHEIRNPLSGISLFLDILCDPNKFDRTDQEAEILEEIRVNVNRISEIIKQVLNFARSPMESKDLIVINGIIDEILKLWFAKILKSDIHLETNLDPELPQILGDTIQLQQVMNNLILNAVEAMENGGKLIISTCRGASSVYENREVVCVKVEDTGCGLDSKDLENIFNPFFTTKSTGTGLGLPISHNIIEKHGGIISVMSEHNSGTIFTVEIPAYVGSEPPGVAENSMTILS
ncbi:PAS domain S-box protein [Desulfonema magnum]|uniref:histidine kinase n=1 Tax=Desulfonema magnum TaxID=45655 RepID=A0A975GQ57_9BACT|nr:PAS domain S-box protein [Desulfonema magnum]QTA89550.1 Two component system histidine kianse, PAS domain-containing [Desulfonema magnum]